MSWLPFDYAVRNLGRSSWRCVLLIIGSALLMLVVLTATSFVRGMNLSIRETGSVDNVILLSAGSEESIERSEVDMGIVGEAAASIRGVREQDGVAFISPEVHVMLTVRLPDHQRTSTGSLATIRGITPAALLVHEAVTIVAGRFPETGRDEVLVGTTAAARLGLPSSALAVDGDVEIDGRVWRVVGHFTTGGSIVDSEIWAPLTDLMEATKRRAVSCVVMSADPKVAAFDDIAAFTMLRPDLELVAIRETEYYNELSAFFAPIRMVVWVTGSLIVLAGVLGGLNTMYAAFVSRVREFGTLQAIGFKRRAILASLMQESLVATATGTLLACAFGVFLLDGVAVRFTMGAFGLVVDAPVLTLCLTLGFAVGVAGTIPPAIRCLRMPIPTALKAV